MRYKEQAPRTCCQRHRHCRDICPCARPERILKPRRTFQVILEEMIYAYRKLSELFEPREDRVVQTMPRWLVGGDKPTTLGMSSPSRPRQEAACVRPVGVVYASLRRLTERERAECGVHSRRLHSALKKEGLIRLSEAPLSSSQDDFAWDSNQQEMTVSAFSYIELLLHAASFANGRSFTPCPPQL